MTPCDPNPTRILPRTGGGGKDVIWRGRRSAQRPTLWERGHRALSRVGTVRIMQFEPGTIAIGLIGKRDPHGGSIQHDISLETGTGHRGQPKALRRPASTLLSVGHCRGLSPLPAPRLTGFTTRFGPPARNRPHSHASAPSSARIGAIATLSWRVRTCELRAWRSRHASWPSRWDRLFLLVS
jgi:hypothetical protein